MGYSFFLLPLASSFAISALLLIILIMIGRRYPMPDFRTSRRHTHRQKVSRFGGVALICSFIVMILLDRRLIMSTPLMGVLCGSVGILLLGLIDDIKPISWKTQLFFQFAIVMSVYIMGVRLQYMTNPFGGILFFKSGIGLLISIVWVVFLMNALNWVDGIDGVSGGITFIGGVTIFILSLRPEVNQPPIGIITTILLGSLVAFILFNFYPAKIMAGTSGSMFMGFILAIMAIFAGAKIATTLLVLAVPIIDALWVIIERFKAGDSIFSADKRHLHFRLQELGWSPIKICFSYYGLTTLIAIIALNTHAFGKMVGFTLVTAFMLSVFFVIHRKTFMIKKD